MPEAVNYHLRMSYVKNLILDKSPNLNIEVKIIRTTGDNNINQKFQNRWKKYVL